MKAKPFDLEVFLSKADGGRAITQYRNGQVIYNQADPADAVFYIRSGESRSPFFLIKARKRLLRCIERKIFLARAV